MKNNNDIFYEQQRNWFFTIFVGIMFAIIITVAAVQDDIDIKDLLIVVAAMFTIFFLITLLTYKQVVVADSIGVTVILGVGLIKRSISYDCISEASIVKLRGRSITAIGLPPFAGASMFKFRGFNYASQTVIYNTGMCRRGVAISQPDRRKSLYVIGSRTPEEFAAFIHKRLPKK